MGVGYANALWILRRRRLRGSPKASERSSHSSGTAVCSTYLQFFSVPTGRIAACGNRCVSTRDGEDAQGLRQLTFVLAHYNNTTCLPPDAPGGNFARGKSAREVERSVADADGPRLIPLLHGGQEICFILRYFVILFILLRLFVFLLLSHYSPASGNKLWSQVSFLPTPRRVRAFIYFAERVQHFQNARQTFIRVCGGTGGMFKAGVRYFLLANTFPIDGGIFNQHTIPNILEMPFLVQTRATMKVYLFLAKMVSE